MNLLQIPASEIYKTGLRIDNPKIILMSLDHLLNLLRYPNLTSEQLIMLSDILTNISKDICNLIIQYDKNIVVVGALELCVAMHEL